MTIIDFDARIIHSRTIDILNQHQRELGGDKNVTIHCGTRQFPASYTACISSPHLLLKLLKLPLLFLFQHTYHFAYAMNNSLAAHPHETNPEDDDMDYETSNDHDNSDEGKRLATV